MKNVSHIKSCSYNANRDLIVGWIRLTGTTDPIRDYDEVRAEYNHRLDIWIKNPMGPKPTWGQK